MTIHEKIKRDYLLFGLDESFPIADLIYAIRFNFNLEEKEINLKTIELIKFLLKNDLFEVCDLNVIDLKYIFTKWNLNLEETLLKIKSMLDNKPNKDAYWSIYFQLTPKGEKEAKEYLNKQNIIKERILLACQDNILDIDKAMAFVQEIFATQDPEEIEYEFLDCISSLTGWHFIEVAILADNKFQTLKYSVYPEPFENIIKKQMEYAKKSQIMNVIFCRIIHRGQLVLDEWKKSGGRISDYFDKFIKVIDLKDLGY